MSVTIGYLYNQIIPGVLESHGNIERRNRMAYAKPLELQQGINNKVSVQIFNRDQKPVNIGGNTFNLRIIDPVNNREQYSTAMTISNGLRGIIEGVIPKHIVAGLSNRVYHYSVLMTDGEGVDYPVYIDDNYNAVGMVEIVDDAYGISSSLNEEDVNAGPGESFSSHYPITDYNTLHTFAFYTEDYTGTIDILGHVDDIDTPNLADFFVIESINLIMNNGIHTTSFTGPLKGIKIRFTTTDGSVSKFQHRY